MAGSRFVRADLHVHTLLGPGESQAQPPSVEAVVRAAISQGISVLGVTDHNSVANVRDALSLASPELLILPGIEVSTADGHLLGLFPPDRVADLEYLSQPASLGLRRLSADGQQRSTRSMADIVRQIEARGGIAIAAHVDTTDGLLARANNASLSDLLAEPGLVGFEITVKANDVLFTDGDPEENRRRMWAERQTRLGWRAPLAHVMSSDAHTPADVGADKTHRTLTRVRVDALTFDAVKAALALYPEARCKLEADLAVHYPRLVSARFEGGFLGGLNLSFSPNLNCLIGGRGSGKTTILRAIRYALAGEGDVDWDSQPNMPEYTEVTLVDALGTQRTFGRGRHQRTLDVSAPNALASMPFTDLEQDFGSELSQEDIANPLQAHEFLGQFVSLEAVEAREIDTSMRLAENADIVRRTSVATRKLKEFRETRTKLDRELTTATGANLAKVAQYARYIATEAPLLADLHRALTDLPNGALPSPPDITMLAKARGVDLSQPPASKHVEGTAGLRASLEQLRANMEASRVSSAAKIRSWTAPALSRLGLWQAEHDKWEAEIDRRKKKLAAEGLKLQVEELDRLRRELKVTDEEIRKYEDWSLQHRTARSERKTLLQSLREIRDRRHDERQAVADRLTSVMMRNSPGMTVNAKWIRHGMRAHFADRLGQLFALHSPRKERLAASTTPSELADMAWRNDLASLGALGGPADLFFPDPAAAMATLRTFDVIFEMETMDLDDRPDVRVKFATDARGPGRRLSELSLGQLRSVLLGFILASPSTGPLVLDQPEEQLDGPFIAGAVVGYIHGVKEQRQLLLATHNANIVVLGDAELVIPLHVELGRPIVGQMGSVDNPSTREEVVTLLEGGIVAFERRAVRYGFTVMA